MPATRKLRLPTATRSPGRRCSRRAAWSPTSASPRRPATTTSRCAGKPPGSRPKTSVPSWPFTEVTRSLSGAASSTPGRLRTRAASEFGSSERVKSTTPLWKRPKSARPTWIRSFAVRRTPAASERSATIRPTPFATQAAYAAPLILLAQTRQADRDKAAAGKAEHHHDLATRHAEQRVAAIKAETDRLQQLLEANTDLTRQDKELTEQVASLTREIHALLSPRGSPEA